MRVFKFGGASVKDAQAVRNMRDIIASYAGEKLLVVVSAMGKTTNALEDLLDLAGKPESKQAFEGVYFDLKKYHEEIAKDLFGENIGKVAPLIDKYFYALAEALNLPADDFDFKYDQVVCFGELISTAIVAAFLNLTEVPCQWVDSRLCIQAEEQWRDGVIDWQWTEMLVQAKIPSILENKTVLTQGFLGGTINGHTCTLGREGSDFSAAIFAKSLKAESVTIWKDVPGILNADPKKVKDTVLLESLSYRDAAEMTYYGATVIHPKTIKPLANDNIPLYVRSFIKTDAPGTCISAEGKTNNVPVIIFKGKQALINFTAKDLSTISKRAVVRCFDLMHKLNVNVNLTQSSATSFSVCVDYHEGKVESLNRALGNDFEINMLADMELVTLKNHDTAFLSQYAGKPGNVVEQMSVSNYQIVRK